MTRPGKTPKRALGTSQDFLVASSESMHKVILFKLLSLMNFSLSSAFPLDMPITSAPNFLKSGAFFSKAHASLVHPGELSFG